MISLFLHWTDLLNRKEFSQTLYSNSVATKLTNKKLKKSVNFSIKVNLN